MYAGHGFITSVLDSDLHSEGTLFDNIYPDLDFSWFS
jgi:hypothetical protein